MYTKKTQYAQIFDKMNTALYHCDIYKKQLGKDGFSLNEKIFIDTEQAIHMAGGIKDIVEQVHEDMKMIQKNAIQESEMIWDATLEVPFGFILSPLEVREAYKAGGVTYSAIVEDTKKIYEEKITKSEKIRDEFIQIETKIQQSIQARINQDQQLAGEIAQWKNLK